MTIFYVQYIISNTEHLTPLRHVSKVEAGNRRGHEDGRLHKGQGGDGHSTTTIEAKARNKGHCRKKAKVRQHQALWQYNLNNAHEDAYCREECTHYCIAPPVLEVVVGQFFLVDLGTSGHWNIRKVHVLNPRIIGRHVEYKQEERGAH